MGEFVKVAKVADVPVGEMIGVTVGQSRVVIANVDGQLYAVHGFCTHMDGPMDEGFLEGTTLECPWHAGQFSIETGEVLTPPPNMGLATYRVRIQGEDVEIEQPS